jgi:hypothetical protein
MMYERMRFDLTHIDDSGVFDLMIHAYLSRKSITIRFLFTLKMPRSYVA